MSRHRAFVAQIPVVGGKPDLDLPASAEYWNEWPERLWHAMWQGHYMVCMKLGTIGGDVVVAGVGDKQILLGLAHLGAKVQLFKDAWANPTRRAWLEAHGVTTDPVSGRPQAPIMYSGDASSELAEDYPEP